MVIDITGRTRPPCEFFGFFTFRPIAEREKRFLWAGAKVLEEVFGANGLHGISYLSHATGSVETVEVGSFLGGPFSSATELCRNVAPRLVEVAASTKLLYEGYAIRAIPEDQQGTSYGILEAEVIPFRTRGEVATVE